MERFRQITMGEAIQENKFGAFRAKQVEPHRILIDTALEKVSSEYAISVDDILGPSRRQDIVQARHLVAFFLHNNTELPLVTIALGLGRVNHTTTLNAIRKISERMEIDLGFKERVERTCSEILDLLPKE